MHQSEHWCIVLLLKATCKDQSRLGRVLCIRRSKQYLTKSISCIKRQKCKNPGRFMMSRRLICKNTFLFLFKGISHLKMNICWYFLSDLEKCWIASLAHQWILCSEWVPSEWESKQLIKTSQVTHTTPVHQLMSYEAKSRMFVRNKSINKACLTSNHLFQLKLFLRCLMCAYFSPDSDETTF